LLERPTGRRQAASITASHGDALKPSLVLRWPGVHLLERRKSSRLAFIIDALIAIIA
jgi:hypothetical protein